MQKVSFCHTCTYHSSLTATSAAAMSFGGASHLIKHDLLNLVRVEVLEHHLVRQRWRGLLRAVPGELLLPLCASSGAGLASIKSAASSTAARTPLYQKFAPQTKNMDT